MSWQEQAHLVPSRNRELLASLVGRRISGLVHHASESPSSLLADESYEARSITARELFSLADGPVVVTFDDGRDLLVSGSEELYSVTIEPTVEADVVQDWDGHIDAADPIYSDCASVIGLKVSAVRVLQRVVDAAHLTQPTASGVRVTSPKLLDRPREVGLILDLEGGGGLLFSFGLLDAPNNFAVFLATALKKSDMPFTEVLSIPSKAR